jgi:hypothetical protein
MLGHAVPLCIDTYDSEDGRSALHATMLLHGSSDRLALRLMDAFSSSVNCCRQVVC